MAKASLSDLMKGTHKGRPTKTGGRGYSATAGLGVSHTNIRADPRETAARMTGITPVPTGPEPGHGGTTY